MAKRTNPPADTQMSIREKLQAASTALTKTKEFEVGGEKFLAIGLMTGPRNRLIEESRRSDGETNVAKMNPRLIAMCIHTPDGKPVWNVNNGNDLMFIDGLAPAITEPMTAAANFVNGWTKEAIAEGKDASATPNTNSDSSSPVALVAA